jgi:hypothetical protein
VTDELWPALPYDEWKDTYATLHMWAQIVGKVALAQAPPLNHSWAVALQVTPRGLSTRSLPHRGRSFAMHFDFVDHQLIVQASDGATSRLPLRAQSVASFYREVMSTLEAMALPVKIWPMPVEVPSPVRFDQDTGHHAYDPEYATRCWRILSQVARVFARTQCGFVGKSSPVHFFWGAFDLAVTRFSGKRAPAREGPAFMREAYSHEVISHGFWPGGGASTMFGPGPVEEPAFYAYAVPAPEGFEKIPVEPSAAFYQRDLGEFILPYNAVRGAGDPDGAIRRFVETTYTHAADLAKWDRAALERTTT